MAKPLADVEFELRQKAEGSGRKAKKFWNYGDLEARPVVRSVVFIKFCSWS